MLYRFYDPKSGTVKIDGQDLRDLRLAFRKHISVSAQNHYFFNDSVINNIRIANFHRYYQEVDRKTDIETVEHVGRFVPRSEEPEPEILSLMNHFGLHSKIDDLPEKYNFVIGDNGSKLSGGERQRLNIIRTLLKPSEIFVFDEPTNFLDSFNRHKFLTKLVDLKQQQRTVVIISHDLDIAEFCDKVLCFKEDGTYEYDHYRTLLKTDGKFAELWEANNREHLYD